MMVFVIRCWLLVIRTLFPPQNLGAGGYIEFRERFKPELNDCQSPKNQLDTSPRICLTTGYANIGGEEKMFS
jgi:hypothetical protein